MPEYSRWLGTSTLEDTGPTRRKIESKPNTTFHQLFSSLLVGGGWGSYHIRKHRFTAGFSFFLPRSFNCKELSVLPGRGTLVTEQISASQVLLADAQKFSG